MAKVTIAFGVLLIVAGRVGILRRRAARIRPR